MADTLTTFHSSTHEEDGDMEDDDEDRRSHRSSVSRLSICTAKTKQSAYGDDQEDGDVDYMMAHMSQLSLQNSSEVEADEEFCGLGDDSDRESGWNSPPAMRQRGIWRHGGPGMDVESKEWASKGEEGTVERSRRKEAMREREQWLERVWGMRRRRKEGGDDEMDESVESECVMIAKPKGGERHLCMDMDEMKACEDLGFELQPEWTLELPRGMSVSSIDTDSGRNSPLANFRISSPGDDPQDVKARLKMWAQAVASAVRLTADR